MTLKYNAMNIATTHLFIIIMANLLSGISRLLEYKCLDLKSI